MNSNITTNNIDFHFMSSLRFFKDYLIHLREINILLMTFLFNILHEQLHNYLSFYVAGYNRYL